MFLLVSPWWPPLNFRHFKQDPAPCHANGCDPQQSCVQDGVNQSTARPVVNVAFLGSQKWQENPWNPPWALAFRTTLAGLMKQIEIDLWEGVAPQVVDFQRPISLHRPRPISLERASQLQQMMYGEALMIIGDFPSAPKPPRNSHLFTPPPQKKSHTPTNRTKISWWSWGHFAVLYKIHLHSLSWVGGLNGARWNLPMGKGVSNGERNPLGFRKPPFW